MRRILATLALALALLSVERAAVAQLAPAYTQVRFYLQRDVIADPAWKPYLPAFVPNPGPDDYIALADLDLVPGPEVIITGWERGLCGSIGCSGVALRTDDFANLTDWDVNHIKWGPVLYLRDEVYKGLRTGHSDFQRPNANRGPDKKAEFVAASQVPPEILDPIAKFLVADGTPASLLSKALVAFLDFDGDGNPNNDDVFVSFFCERRCDVLLLHRNTDPWVMWEEDMAIDAPRDERGMPVLYARDEFFEGRRTFYEGPLRERVPFGAGAPQAP